MTISIKDKLQEKGKNYTIKKGDEATLVEVTDKYDKNKKYKNFKL